MTMALKVHRSQYNAILPLKNDNLFVSVDMITVYLKKVWHFLREPVTKKSVENSILGYDPTGKSLESGGIYMLGSTKQTKC